MANNNKRGPSIPDVNTLIQAGIDPTTGLPIKLGTNQCILKDAIKKTLRILDEQDAVNRYTWYNLPNGLDGQLIERILYYKGQAMFFYNEIDDTFYFLPYALAGTIDLYGRFNKVQGLPFNGSTEEKGIDIFTRDVIHSIDDIPENAFKTHCVLLKDYTNQISQTNISRSMLQDPILDAMAEAFPFARTSAIANSGVKGMRVNNQDEYVNVNLAAKAITKAALTGEPMVPIIGTIEFQDLTSAGSALKAEEYLVYMQALDNYRLSLYGLKTGGLFQKKSHMLESEQEMNESNTLLVYQDGLTIREKFCDFVNAIWGLGIWVEASECVTGMDANMDGMAMDNQDQSGIPVEQDVMDGGNDE